MGLLKLGVNVKLDARLLRECEVQAGTLIPSTVMSELHRGILMTMPIDSLFALRNRIFKDAKEAFAFVKFIRYEITILILKDKR
jgi:hypothetical protein